MPLKLFIISCEASADLHGSHLVHELRNLHPEIECRGLGGPKMAEEGVTLLEDMTQISALGWGDVVRQYARYKKIFNRALKEVRDWKPDVLVLIDSPAFNLRFAKKIKKKIPVIYYIAPQIWAWGARRIHTIKKTVSKMLVILPFETSVYQPAGVPCEFVGHPLLDKIAPTADREALRREFDIHPDQVAIGLLPGSREKEVTRILPVMMESASQLRVKIPGSVFFVGFSPNVDKNIYQEIIKQYPDLSVRQFDTRYYDHVRSLDFALVTSGTATLETALLGTPFFLLYKTGWSTYLLGRWLIRVPFLGLANLLAGKKIVPEFIQKTAKAERIVREAEALLTDQTLYQQMKKELAEIRGKLGEPGASARTAQAILEHLNSSKAQVSSNIN